MNYQTFKLKGLTGKMLGLYLGAALLAVSFFGGYVLGLRQGKLAAVPEGEGTVVGREAELPDYLSADVDFLLYWKIWDTIKTGYLRQPVSDLELFYGSLKGMVNALDDPHTVFLDPETTKAFSDELAGTFEGIGAEIGIKEGALKIVAPLPETPAARAGVQSGDHIVKIDGKETAGMTVEEAVKEIRGPKGSNVVLTLYRDGFDAPRDFVIARDQIKVPSVRAEFKDGIAVVNIFQFGQDTISEFENVVLDILRKNTKGVILDLRNNPGGFLDAAIRVAEEWVERGEIIVTEKNKRTIEFRGRGPSRLSGKPTVVLVNGGSASGSEIVAGALQDYDYAAVIGTETFGKGSVQDFQIFENGSSLKFTIAEWFTPLGRSIEEGGIAPDEIIEVSSGDIEAERDPQLERAMEILR